MNIRCPNCQTVFRVDPTRVPAGGIRARCSRCAETFFVQRDQDATAPASRPAPVATPTPPARPAPAAAPAPRGEPAEPIAARAPQAPPAGAAATVERFTAPVPPAREPATRPTTAAPSAPAGQPAPAAAPAATAERSGWSAPAAAPTTAPSAARAWAPPTSSAAPAAPATAPARPAETPRPHTFGSRDPDARAMRIARALVSDIIAYHPKRWESSRDAGTLRAEFREEIMKSWEEYVAQVGLELAKSTPHFRTALNEILARGQQIF